VLKDYNTTTTTFVDVLQLLLQSELWATVRARFINSEEFPSCHQTNKCQSVSLQLTDLNNFWV